MIYCARFDLRAQCGGRGAPLPAVSPRLRSAFQVGGAETESGCGGAACAARASRAAPRHAGRRPESPAVPALPGPLDRARLSRASNERDGHGDGSAHGPQGGGGCVGCA